MNTFPKECIACGRDALAIPEAPALAVIINIKTKERVGICADCAIVVLATLRPAIATRHETSDER